MFVRQSISLSTEQMVKQPEKQPTNNIVMVPKLKVQLYDKH